MFDLRGGFLLLGTVVLGRWFRVGCVTGVALLAGCQSVGPHAMRSSTQPYNESVNSVRDEQLLLNIVRLKYRDTPSFLEITSISTAYERSAGLGAEGQLRQGAGNNALLLRPNLNISERPTITYVPMQGDRFAKNLLTPLPIEALVYLSQSGWSAERILRVCVQRMNRVRNAPTASGPTPAEAPEFRRFQEIAAHLRALQQADGVFLLPSADDQPGAADLVIAPEWSQSPEALAFKEALGLDPSLDRFPLLPGLTQIDDRSIAISTRSLLGVLFFFSQSVEVSPAAQTAGIVTTTRQADGQPFDWGPVYRDLFRVQRSTKPPGGAYLKTRYRGGWYFIDDADLQSKSTFFMLDLLFAIQSGDSRSLTPILTLPVSR
ncbi:MAG: hypothetical protein JJT96_11020 [Opitutales bacterium]|nr:hypothetical protein [Opitutales bacterium]